jgi:Yip1 domain
MAKQLNINPWVKIWTKPRETIRAIVQFNPKFRILYLAGIYGFPLMLNFAQSASLSESVSLPVIFVLALLLSVPIGMISFTVSSALVYWVGKLLRGQGSFLGIRAAIAWSNVPNIGTILTWLFLIGAFGAQLFFRGFTEMPFRGAAAVYANCALLVQAILSIWSFVLLIRGVQEVQKYSVWRAIVNIVLSFVIVCIAMWILLVIYMWLTQTPA